MVKAGRAVNEALTNASSVKVNCRGDNPRRCGGSPGDDDKVITPKVITPESVSADDRGGARTEVHDDVALLVDDALEPGEDGRKRGQIVVALVRDVRIGVERYVGDGVAVGREEVVGLQVRLHHADRLVAFLHPVLDGVVLQLAPALDQGEPEPRGADVRLKGVL